MERGKAGELPDLSSPLQPSDRRVVKNLQTLMSADTCGAAIVREEPAMAIFPISDLVPHSAKLKLEPLGLSNL